PINGKSQRCQLSNVISCVQSQLITCTLIIRALMISVSDDQCSPSRATCQCPSMPAVSAHQCLINATYQCLPVHINATYQCPSELPFSATYQCRQSVPPISASVPPISHVLPSVMPVNVHQC
ncbi:unnamed protein product, partial [Staurois parvus]